MRCALTLVVIAAACTAAAADSDVVTTSGFGCRDRSTFERALEFADAGDQVAFAKFLRTAIESGECRGLAVGDQIYVEDVVFGGPICVRPKGETVCFWSSPYIIR